MKKNVVLLFVCCTLVWLALISEKGGVDSIPLAHQETVITSGDSGLQSPIPEGLHHREKKVALQTGVGSQSDRSAPDPTINFTFWYWCCCMADGYENVTRGVVSHGVYHLGIIAAVFFVLV